MGPSIVQPKAETNHFPIYILSIFMVYWIFLAIHPVNRMNWLVENILVVLGVVLLGITYQKFRFSNLSYVLITLLLAFHSFGAHYTYSGVPFSISVPFILDPNRNNFDRAVHFLWGLLISYPTYEFLLRVAKISVKWIIILTISTVIAASAIFELMEMWGAKMMAEGQAAMYMGMQGDIWDSHEDIAMALYGSLITMGIIIYLRHRVKHKKLC